MPDIKSGEVVIEFDHPRNNKILFFPAMTLLPEEQSKLRSKIISGRSGPGGPRPFTTITSIPGQRVHVDPKTGAARITDALGDKENSALLEKVKNAAQNTTNTANWRVSGPIPTVEAKLDQTGVRNWLFWMARHVENKEAVLLSGELKSPAEYRKAGDVKLPSTHPRWLKEENGGSYLKPVEAGAAS